MSITTTQVQFRRGSASDNNAFAGASGEISIDLTDYRIHVHDGSGTLGGWPTARMFDINNLSGYSNNTFATISNVQFTGINALLSTANTGSILYNDITGLSGQLITRDNNISGVLQNQINNISGGGSTGAANIPPGIVYQTGNQIISGQKTFSSGLYSTDTLLSIDTNGRKLTYLGNTSVDWGSLNLYNGNNIVGIDWGLGIIKGINDNNTSIHYGNRQLTDNLSTQSLDWQNRILKDPSNNQSLDYGNKIALDINGATSINWSGRILSGNWNFQSGNFTQTISLSPSIQSSNLNLSNFPFYINTGNAVVTWTLPLISSTNGKIYQIKNRGNSIILTGTASDKIFAQYPVLNFTVNSGEAYQLANDGMFWCVM